MAGALRKGKRAQALAVAASWALLLALGLGILEWKLPGLVGLWFPGAQDYAQQMLHWVQTGEGCEGKLACFFPQHVAHLLLFACLTLSTGGLGGLALGSLLMAWMGAYTGGLAQASQSPWALILGWHPWAVLRVVGYLLLGVALAEPLIRGKRLHLPPGDRWIWAGLFLCALDLLLKALLASWWRSAVLLKLFTGAP
jgi:hypothetical protein